MTIGYQGGRGSVSRKSPSVKMTVGAGAVPTISAARPGEWPSAVMVSGITCDCKKDQGMTDCTPRAASEG